MTKLIKGCFSVESDIESIIKKGTPIIDSKIPIIAIPTTADSGMNQHILPSYILIKKILLQMNAYCLTKLFLMGTLAISFKISENL